MLILFDQGGEDELEAAMLREDSPGPGPGASGRRTPIPRPLLPGVPALADAMGRKRGSGDMVDAPERVPPNKRSRYYPSGVTPRPPSSPLFTEVSFPPSKTPIMSLPASFLPGWTAFVLLCCGRLGWLNSEIMAGALRLDLRMGVCKGSTCLSAHPCSSEH